MKKIAAIFLLLSVVLVGCEKEEDTDDHSDILLVFSSLTCGRDTIFTEDTTMLRAFASGYDLNYYWSVDKGDLLGSDSVVTYVATPCTIGENEIFCKVSDGNGQEITKSVIVTVF